MHLAVEEKADLPAFLIHDSPREADLDGTLYARLFDLINRWETESSEPCFQYIITTTTAPPTRLQSDEYVPMKMSSTPQAARLFWNGPMTIEVPRASSSRRNARRSPGRMATAAPLSEVGGWALRIYDREGYDLVRSRWARGTLVPGPRSYRYR